MMRPGLMPRHPRRWGLGWLLLPICLILWLNEIHFNDLDPSSLLPHLLLDNNNSLQEASPAISKLEERARTLQKSLEWLLQPKAEGIILQPHNNQQLPSWTQYVGGSYFALYKQYIDSKISVIRQLRHNARVENQHRRQHSSFLIQHDQHNFPKNLDTREDNVADYCRHRLWEGEFGMELINNVPWAHFKSLDQSRCGRYKEPLVTQGLPGTTYLYYFSDHHATNNKRRSFQYLAMPNPFGQVTVHTERLRRRMPWQPPPYKGFFRNPFLAELFPTTKNRNQTHGQRSLVIVLNKYSREWGGPPINFFSTKLLETLLHYLTVEKEYDVVYKRHTSVQAGDHQEEFMDLGEKEGIRTKFSQHVVLFEDLLATISMKTTTSSNKVRASDEADTANLLLFQLAAHSGKFLTVQGGLPVIASYFGGHNLILAKKGLEIENGDYHYFHKLSNASIFWTDREDEFLQHVKTIL